MSEPRVGWWGRYCRRRRTATRIVGPAVAALGVELCLDGFRKAVPDGAVNDLLGLLPRQPDLESLDGRVCEIADDSFKAPVSVPGVVNAEEKRPNCLDCPGTVASRR